MYCLCLSAFLSAFRKLGTALSRFCQCLPKQSSSRHPPAAPLALLGTTLERTDCLIPQQQDSSAVSPLYPGTEADTTTAFRSRPWRLLSVMPPQPPTSYQLYFLALPQMEKVGVYKGLGPRPLIILSYLQYGFRINPASSRSTISVNPTISRGKGICDFETVWVNCYWNRWNVNENKV